jgi:DNA recombination protein RmuC
MFVPSESIFADIHERFEDLVQKAHRSRIVIVSPSLLMLSIQVVTSLLRDQRMREQAHLIQEEVAKMMDDVGRLDDRVKRLATHFAQSNKDIDEILISTKRVTARGGRIAAVEVNGVEDQAPKPKAVSRPTASAQRTRPAPPELPFSRFDEV